MKDKDKGLREERQRKDKKEKYTPAGRRAQAFWASFLALFPA